MKVRDSLAEKDVQTSFKDVFNFCPTYYLKIIKYPFYYDIPVEIINTGLI